MVRAFEDWTYLRTTLLTLVLVVSAFYIPHGKSRETPGTIFSMVKASYARMGLEVAEQGINLVFKSVLHYLLARVVLVDVDATEQEGTTRLSCPPRRSPGDE